MSGDYSYLSEIGISFNKDGTLSTDSATLNNAINTNLNSVTELFSDDDQGFAFRLSALLDNMLDDNGLINTKQDSINAQIDSAQDDQVRLQLRLEKTEERYRAQYSMLDLLMSNMQATSKFLDNQLPILANLLPGNS